MNKSQYYKQREKYRGIIAGMAITIAFLAITALLSVFLCVKTIEQYSVISFKIVEIGKENIELQSEIEFYRQIISQ